MTKHKKQWLEQAWKLKAEIEHWDWVMAGGAFGADCCDEPDHTDRLAQIKECRAQAFAQLEKRKQAINRLKNPDQKKILWLRYIEHYKWEDIFYSMNYGKTRCHEIHNRAVAQLETV